MLASSAIPAIFAFICAVSAQAPNWGQCGGSGWTGPTKCNPGWNCIFLNEWHSQCLQEPSVSTTCSDPIDRLQGYAAGSSGGGFGVGITVTSCEALKAAAQEHGVIRVSGTLYDCGIVNINGFTSLLGIGSESGFVNSSIHVIDASHVIIRNLRFTRPPKKYSSILLERATYVWIDHNEFKNRGIHGDRGYSQLDIRSSSYATVSWNTFTENWEGSSVSNLASDSAGSNGTPWVTYHHNWWFNVKSDAPSIQSGVAHIYSSCFENITTSGVNVREGARAFIQNNHFSSVNQAITTSLSTKVQGFVTERNNTFYQSPTKITQAGHYAVTYPYTMDAAECVCNRIRVDAVTMSDFRRPILFNDDARRWTAPPTEGIELVAQFHKSFPGYNQTPLVSLDNVAKEIGVGAVYLKNETTRMELPAFKILGASWGAVQAIKQHLGLPISTSFEDVKKALKTQRVTLYAASEGNHGRAVSRVGMILGLTVEIHVSYSVSEVTVGRIESEGSKVIKNDGNYDDAVKAAYEAATANPQGILIQDNGFEGYEVIPQWIVQGYQTMMQEIEDQLGDKHADLVVCPIGVGSLGHSVVSYFRQAGKNTSVMSVEPDCSACLYKSKEKGQMVTVDTIPTIMEGLNCGSVSTTAWSDLCNGITANSTVSDYEVHKAVAELHAHSVPAGPCGAASLAALRRLSAEDKSRLKLGAESTVILLCTEGARDYATPLDVSSDDPVTLTQNLVRIDSASPTLGSTPGPGETAVARYVKAWLEHRDIETHWLEPTPGRPSIIGVAHGSGGGKSLMFNGHIDVVTLQGYDGNALSGKLENGKVFGRGAADMKSGIAANLVALTRAKKLGLKGDVIFAGVADEEDASIGTEQLLEAGWRADAAVVTEPTNHAIFNAHLGFVWVAVDIHGVAAHGSRPEEGVDAICHAGHFLVKLHEYSQKLRNSPGSGSIHASLIKGGEEPSSYPAKCTITIERRSLPGQNGQTVHDEVQKLLTEVSSENPRFKYDVRVLFSRPPFNLEKDHPFAKVVGKHVEQGIGKDATWETGSFWTDAALLLDAGIPSLIWGPDGEGLHGKEEWVDADSVRMVADTLTAIAKDFCS
ncbi:Diaminopropionate ammonia-lyase [Paramyrothecium foliicola]|nr:Diaminopropionate ammonia-lyase [Paramyrothecium foliicola]